MFCKKSNGLRNGIVAISGVAVFASLLLGYSVALAEDIHPECDAGGETPNYPSLACQIVPVVQNGQIVGEDCVGQTTPTSQACSGFVQKIIEPGECVTGTNPPEVKCSYYSETIEQDALLAQCEENVNGEGEITSCDCITYDVSQKADTTYTECTEIATV